MRARDDQLRLFLRRDRACAVDCPQRRPRAVGADDDCPIAHIASISRLTTTRHYRPDFVFEAHWADPGEPAPGRRARPVRRLRLSVRLKLAVAGANRYRAWPRR